VLKLNHLSDQQLIILLNKGGAKENRAIQFLLDDNRKKITTYILRNNGDKSDAASILVEGVTHLVFNVRNEKFRGDSRLSTYLFAICNGLWLKELKKRKRFTNFDTEENGNDILVEDLTPFDHFSSSQLEQEVILLLARLGNACKMVLRLWAEHFSMAEISDQLGYKNSQIAMNKKNKCLNKLKEVAMKNEHYSESLRSYLS